MKKLFFTILLLFAFLLTACTENKSGGQQGLTWASGAQGGGWYTMAGGISTMIKEEEGINISTIPGGSLQNMPFIANNEAQLAWMQPPFVLAGINGEEPFDQKFSNVSVIGNGFGTNHFHLLVSDSIKYETADDYLRDIQNMNVAVTPVNNSDEWVFRKVLEYLDTDYDSIKKEGGKVIHASYQEQTDALRNGNIDAAFSQLSLPSAAIMEATVNKKLKLLPFSNELVNYISQFGLDPEVIAKGTYPDLINHSEDINTFAMGNVLTVNSELDEDTVYKITKVINEKHNELVNIHASLKDYNPESATLNLVAPLHKGAEKYYKEVGIIK